MYSNNIYLKQLYFWVRWLTLVLPLIPHWKVPPSLKFIFSISLFCGWLHLSLLSNTQNSCIRSSIHFTLGSLDTWPCRLIWKKNSLVYTFIQNLNAGVWLPNPVTSQTSSLSQPQWLNTVKKKKTPSCPYVQSAVLLYAPISLLLKTREISTSAFPDILSV